MSHDHWLHEGPHTAAELEAHGWGKFARSAAVRAGELIPLARGVYVSGDAHARAVQQGSRAVHVLRTKAELLERGTKALASHHSAALLHGLPVWDCDLRTVHLTRTDDQRARRAEGVLVHQRVIRQARVTIEGWASVGVADAVVGVGLASGTRLALVKPFLIAADAALHTQAMTWQQLDAAVKRHARYRAITPIRDALELVDQRHESPGETRLAGVMRDLGWASKPQVQHVIEGQVVRCDRQLDEAPVVVEFDGESKYGWGLEAPSSADLRRELMAEKRREDLLRSVGFEVVRVVWDDLDHPWCIDARIKAALDRGRRGMVA